MFKIFFLLLVSLLSTGYVGATTTNIRLYNACPFPVWPAWIPNAGISQVGEGGARIDSWQSYDLALPWGWAGRFWGRTSCYFKNNKGSCETGDCNNEYGCTAPGKTPVTLAEFTPLHKNSHDYYDVSVVDGYNLPIRITPSDAKCKSAGCNADVNVKCPAELAVRSGNGATVACKSACLAYKRDEYCCTGEYASADKCKPSMYSQFFKNYCPKAYTYAYDTVNSSYTCPSGASYVITFCPEYWNVGNEQHLTY